MIFGGCIDHTGAIYLMRFPEKKSIPSQMLCIILRHDDLNAPVAGIEVANGCIVFYSQEINLHNTCF
jgi:hypothetical protein